MRSINRATLLGNIGKDAEVKFTQSGASVANFSIATERRWKDRRTGEWVAETDWHNVVLWKAENIGQYLLKGTKVYVEGRLQTRSYEDREGVKRYTTEIVADNLILLGSGKGGDAKGEPGQQAGADFDPGMVDDGEIPF